MQKAIRKQDRQFIACTCHYDVEEWLMPDWIFNTLDMTFKVNKPLAESKKKDQTSNSKSQKSQSRKEKPSIGKSLVSITI